VGFSLQKQFQIVLWNFTVFLREKHTRLAKEIKIFR